MILLIRYSRVDTSNLIIARNLTLYISKTMLSRVGIQPWKNTLRFHHPWSTHIKWRLQCEHHPKAYIVIIYIYTICFNYMILHTSNISYIIYNINTGVSSKPRMMTGGFVTERWIALPLSPETSTISLSASWNTSLRRISVTGTKSWKI